MLDLETSDAFKEEIRALMRHSDARSLEAKEMAVICGVTMGALIGRLSGDEAERRRMFESLVAMARHYADLPAPH